MVLKSLVVRQLGRRFPHLMAARLPVTVKAVIVSSDRRVLVLKKTGGAHDLPGGKVDAGETIEEALCREVMEETGLKLGPIEMVTSWVKTHHVNGNRLFIVFRSDFENKSAKAKIQLSSEHEWGGFVHIHEAMNLQFSLGQCRAVLEALTR